MSSLSLRCPNCKESFQTQNAPGNLSAICPRCNRVMRWFYAQNNQRYGPLLFGQLSQLAQSRTIQSSDWVFQEGSEGWVAARDVPDLFSARPTTTPAVVPDNTTLTGMTNPTPKGQPTPQGITSRSAAGTAKRIPAPARSSRRKLYVALVGFAVAAAAAVLIVVLILNSGEPAPAPPHDPPPNQQAGENPPQNNPGQPVNQNPDPKGKMSGQEVYKKTLPSTVWILTNKGTGSGSLIDKDLRLVITNAHVVPLAGPDNMGKFFEAPVTVYFPMYKDGKLVAEKDYYNPQRYPGGAIAGKVVSRDQTRDLALVQLDKLPPGAGTLKLAKDSASPGETVHAIGNPGASGALWVYTSGSTRNVYHKAWQSGPQGGPVVPLNAQVVETQVPANPGDSGGPLVNDFGELVGVTQGFSAGATLLSYAIDISEVHNVVNTYKKTNMASFPK